MANAFTWAQLTGRRSVTCVIGNCEFCKLQIGCRASVNQEKGAGFVPV